MMKRDSRDKRLSPAERRTDQLAPVIDSLGMCSLQNSLIRVDVDYWRTWYTRAGGFLSPLLGVDELIDWIAHNPGNYKKIGESQLEFFSLPRDYRRMGCGGELSIGYEPRTLRIAKRVPPEDEGLLGVGFLIHDSDQLVTMCECKFCLDDDLLSELGGDGDVYKTVLSVAGPLRIVNGESSYDDRRIGRIVHYGPRTVDLVFDQWVLARWFIETDRYAVAFCYRGDRRVAMMCYTPWIEANTPDYDPKECGSSDC